MFGIDPNNIVLETVKPTEAASKREIILRLYESMGSRTKAQLITSLPLESVFIPDMLMNKLESKEYHNGIVDLVFGPFEIITLKLKVRI